VPPIELLRATKRVLKLARISSLPAEGKSTELKDQVKKTLVNRYE
jgi:hypothetical protein